MNPTAEAVRLLREAAEGLKAAHTVDGDWGTEQEARAAYEHQMAVAQALEQSDLAKLQAEFEAYREGSEEAFGSVVDQKKDLEDKAARQFETIQTQGQIIARMRTQLEEKGIPYVHA